MKKKIFSLNKRCKSKDNPDDKAATARERLNKKYKTISVPSKGQVGETVYRFIFEERSIF